MHIGPAQALTSAKTGNAYTKRDLVITVRLFDPYTGQPTEDSGNTPKFTFMGERCRDLDQYKAGDIVTVDFDISGRKYEKDGRTEYATDVRPFRISPNRPSQPQSYQQPQQQQQQQAYQPQEQVYQQPQTAQTYQQPPQEPQAYQQPQQGYAQPSKPNLPF